MKTSAEIRVRENAFGRRVRTGDGRAEALTSLALREAADRAALQLRGTPAWDWPDPMVPRDAPSDEILAMFSRGRHKVD